MNSKNLLIYDSVKLFQILDEIKENLNFKINFIAKSELSKIEFEKYNNYLVVTTEFNKDIKNCLVINSLPKKIKQIIELINLGFLRNQFNNQSKIKIGKYILDLNSRKINFGKINIDLTEKECDLILFIQANKKVNLKKIQKNVWNYSSDLETHTVETHIYRIRKKMIDNFNDPSFIKFDKEGYSLN